MSRGLEKLVARIGRLERAVYNRMPSLSHSSIEGGAITAYTPEGTQTMVVGEQADGTHTAASVGGPPPPMPVGLSTRPTVAGGVGVWDGTFLDGVNAPMDFARVEYHISSVGPDFTPDVVGENSSTMFGSTSSPRGGEAMAAPLPYQTHWIRLVARSQSGKFSDPSPAVAVNPIKVATVDLDDLAVTTGKIAAYAITADKVEDFAFGVTKFRSTQHMIY